MQFCRNSCTGVHVTMENCIFAVFSATSPREAGVGPSVAAKKLLMGQPLCCDLPRRRQYPDYNSFQLTETSTNPLSFRDSLFTITLPLALSPIIDKLVTVEELDRKAPDRGAACVLTVWQHPCLSAC